LWIGQPVTPAIRWRRSAFWSKQSAALMGSADPNARLVRTEHTGIAARAEPGGSVPDGTRV